MKIKSRDFEVKPHSDIALKEVPTLIEPFYDGKPHYKVLLDAHVKELRNLQPRLYADNRYALLIMFQAMDAAGKDGAIKHIMSGVNPQGVSVVSFRHPGPDVLAHDFLWNAIRVLPERGRIGIFNRSYYEEVLIVRVHPELLAAERLPEETLENGSIWKGRFRSIRALERHLHSNGTRIVKFFLPSSEGTTAGGAVESRGTRREQAGRSPYTGVVRANVRRAERALERRVPVTEEDVAEAAFQAQRAVTRAPAVLFLATDVRGAFALEPCRQTTAELLFPFEADVAAGGLEDIDILARTALVDARILHVQRAVNLDSARLCECDGRGT